MPDVRLHMTAQLVDSTISLRPPTGLHHLADLDCVRCTFSNCHVPSGGSPAHRFHFRNVRLRRCIHHACWIEGAILEDVVVDSLKRFGRDPLFVRGCAFRHVTLRGPVSFLLPKPHVYDRQTGAPVEAFFRANQLFYQDTDWALDITEAQFGGLVTFAGIPPHLVRRNAASQFVILRTAAAEIAAAYPHSVWAIIAEDLMSLGLTGTVVAVGSRSRTYSRDVAAAQVLREQGLAE